VKNTKSNQKIKLVEDENGFGNLVPLVLAVVIGFALLFIGGYINGVIHQELNGALPQTNSNDNARSTMNNTSENWDSTLNIVQVVIIISVLAAAIGAIFLFTRYQ